MPFQRLQFRPGINRDVTSYTNEGGWRDCNHVRFSNGFPQKIGGWTQDADVQYIGTCRSLHVWNDLSGQQYVGVGTHNKFYIATGGSLYDITPLRSTTAAGDVTFTAVADTLNGAIDASTTSITLTDASDFPSVGRIQIESEVIEYTGISTNTLTGCTRGAGGTTAASHADTTAVSCCTIIVTDTSHGANAGDFVTFSGAAALGGNITADVLNQEYSIASLIDADNYTINARAAGTGVYYEDGEVIYFGGGAAAIADDVYANGSDTGSGGASTVGAYQINIGLETIIEGAGWGAGAWSRAAWGAAATVTASGGQVRIWSQDNFGQVLLACYREGGLYYWNPGSPTALSGDRLELVSSLSGATSVPGEVGRIIVSDRDRHVIAFGAIQQGGSDYDPLLIRFSNQEDIEDWAATDINTAGDLRVGSGSKIVGAVETRQQILVITDSSVHGLQYLGPPFTFGLSALAMSTSIAGPNAVVAANDRVFWMGNNTFYVYDGSVRELSCSVSDYVFDDFNLLQREKVFAGHNSSHSEIWWFYPSDSALENNRYVAYNYEDNIWYYGMTGRTAWVDRGLRDYPLAAYTGLLYDHEFGMDADGAALESYIESSQVTIGEGDQFAFVSRMIPDLSFGPSTAPDPAVSFTVKVRREPGVNYDDSDTREVSMTATTPVQVYTEHLYLRLRGRSLALRVSSDDIGVTWRLGSPRVDIRTDGRR